MNIYGFEPSDVHGLKVFFVSLLEVIFMKYLLMVLMAVSVFGCDQGSDMSSDTTKKAAVTKTADVVTAPIKVLRGNVFEYGIYNAQRKGRVLGSLTTNTGKVVTRPVLELAETTDRIPLLKGTYFAYRYRILDLPKEEAKKPVVELRKVLVHPVMTLPDGTTSTGWDRTSKGRTSIGQVIAFDGYVFNEDYELVEGDWIFQIWFKDKMLVEQTFTTYQPEKSGADVKAGDPAAVPAVVVTTESKI
jgi:hypothetical protein